MPIQWEITSTYPEINIDLVFPYTDDELFYGNNVTEANLMAFKNTGGDTWTNQCGTYTCTVNTDDNNLTIEGVTSLSTWTLGDPTTSSNTDPTSVVVNSVNGVSGSQTGQYIGISYRFPVSRARYTVSGYGALGTGITFSSPP